MLFLKLVLEIVLKPDAIRNGNRRRRECQHHEQFGLVIQVQQSTKGCTDRHGQIDEPVIQGIHRFPVLRRRRVDDDRMHRRTGKATCDNKSNIRTCEQQDQIIFRKKTGRHNEKEQDVNHDVVSRTFFRGKRSDMYPPTRLTQNPITTVAMRKIPAQILFSSCAKKSAMKGMTADETARLKNDVIIRGRGGRFLCFFFQEISHVEGSLGLFSGTCPQRLEN